MFLLIFKEKSMNSSSNKIHEYLEENIKKGYFLSIAISNTHIQFLVKLLSCTQTLLDISHWRASNCKNET